MKTLIPILFLLAGCSGSHVAPDGGAPTSDAPVRDLCREIYGYQVNEGGRLGFDRVDWPCPAVVVDAASFDACVAFLRTEARTELEVETCEASP